MSSPPSTVSRKLAAAAILAVGVFILAFTMIRDKSGNAGNRDFIEYWAAGQLLVHHANPYDPASVLRVEKSAGWHGSGPLVMLSPPIVLFLTVPLGFVPAGMGAVFWSLLIVASLMFAIRLIWSLNGRPPSRMHLLGYCFAPTLATLFAGQTSALVLLGLVLFLYLHKTGPFLAGMSLTLCMMRPHLFLPFGLVLIGFIFARKAYSLALGALLGFACLLAFTAFYPSSWPEYFAIMRAWGVETKFLPNFSSLLRIAIDRNAAWIQVVPLIVACLWAVWYFGHHRKEWDWSTHGSLLMLVSVLVAPYSWFYDEIVLLPALFQAIYLSADRPRSLVGFAVLTSMAVAQLLAGVTMPSGFYAWTATAWLAWYVYAVYFAGPGRQAKPDLIADQLGKGLEY
jgi:hypothetical protein